MQEETIQKMVTPDYMQWKNQTKTKQNDNPDMKHANCDAKNVRKVFVNKHD